MKIENACAGAEKWKSMSAEHRRGELTEGKIFKSFLLHPSLLCQYQNLGWSDKWKKKKNPDEIYSIQLGNFFTTRKGGNFKQLDIENIQTLHFRISKWFGYWALSNSWLLEYNKKSNILVRFV